MAVMKSFKNSDALVKYMTKLLLMEKGLRHQMGSKSRDLIMSKFERQFIWDCLLNEYNQLL